MTVYRHRFEGYADGAHPDTSTAAAGETALSYVSSTGTLTIRATGALQGSRSLELASSSGGDVPAVGMSMAPADTISISFILKIPSAPVTNPQRILNAYGSGSSTLPRFQIETTGRVSCRDAAGTQIAAASMTAGQTVVGKKVEFRMCYTRGTTTTDGVIATKIIDLDSSTTFVDSGTITGQNTGTVQPDGFRAGRPSTHVSYTATLLLDALAIGNTWGLIDALGVEDSAGAPQVVDPFETFTLTGVGAGPWTQTSGPDVALSGSGATRTGVAAATPEGVEYGFAYGSAPTTVTVRPHNEWWGDVPLIISTPADA